MREPVSTWFLAASKTPGRQQTRRERFLAEMDQVVACSGLLALIEPYYPKAGGGRNPVQATGRPTRIY